MDFMGSNNARKKQIDKALEDAQNPKPKKPKATPKHKTKGCTHMVAPKIK